jgi:hypothetical protein
MHWFNQANGGNKNTSSNIGERSGQIFLFEVLRDKESFEANQPNLKELNKEKSYHVNSYDLFSK